MKSVFKLALLAAVGLPAASQAQLVVDRSKYPDYDPTVRPDRSLRRYGLAHRIKGGDAPAVNQRPAYVNNAANMYFPPIFSQEGALMLLKLRINIPLTLFGCSPMVTLVRTNLCNTWVCLLLKPMVDA